MTLGELIGMILFFSVLIYCTIQFLKFFTGDRGVCGYSVPPVQFGESTYGAKVPKMKSPQEEPVMDERSDEFFWLDYLNDQEIDGEIL